jgi:hypothetical protein
MTLIDFKQHIDKLVKEGHGNKTVVAAGDDEGNYYNDVLFAPSIISVKDIEYYGNVKRGKVVCLN